jgi:chitinase
MVFNVEKLKEDINGMQAKGIKVLIAVGGVSNPDWTNYSATSVASLAKALGVDGIDIDYEPGLGAYSSTEILKILSDTRAALGNEPILSVATTAGKTGESLGWGISASDVKAANSQSASIGLINLMSYKSEAIECYQAFRNAAASAIINIGIDANTSAVSGGDTQITSISDIKDDVAFLASESNAGVMIWVAAISVTNSIPQTLDLIKSLYQNS